VLAEGDSSKLAKRSLVIPFPSMSRRRPAIIDHASRLLQADLARCANLCLRRDVVTCAEPGDMYDLVPPPRQVEMVALLYPFAGTAEPIRIEAVKVLADESC
jgi:hypothetical protein